MARNAGAGPSRRRLARRQTSHPRKEPAPFSYFDSKMRSPLHPLCRGVKKSAAGTMEIPMRAWNRAKLLWGYLARQTRLRGLPVEYIVETTATCNQIGRASCRERV